jgi:CubicO group peptidase (beta-lactamase class C family)
MNRLDRLTPLLQSFVEKGPAGCACRVAQRGETLYEQYVGYADLETKKPINQDTIYRQYSTSKIATCTAALML